MKHVELLAPAGSMEAFRGALNAGADAVYLAGQSFGARAYAQNFTEEELKDVLKEAHLFNVKIYLTVNILTRESELPELVAFVSRLYEAGLDGVIVQDLGVASALRQACPNLLLHASTQMSVTGRAGARFLQRQGFSRVVPARELSLNEMKLLKETGIEVEAFIHGAMCYCYSGRCLMSSFLGGRSGNRGRCAGTCRLPYDVLDEQHDKIEDGSRTAWAESGKSAFQSHQSKVSGKERDQQKVFSGRNEMDRGNEIYPISMRDMCVLPILPELFDAGIDSFKIEGRMKKPEYAAGVTAVYRKYIDRFYDWDAKGRPGKWIVDPEDLALLHQLYIRTDLSTGYYHERNGRDMITIGKPGYAGADPDKLAEIRREYIDANGTRQRKIPLNAAVTIRAGQPAALSVGNAGGNNPFVGSLIAFGDTVQEAQNKPLTAETIREKIGKTGDSPYAFASVRVDTDGHSFLPVSQLNALRREALDQFAKESAEAYINAADHRREGNRKAQPFAPSRQVPLSTAARQKMLICVQTLEQAMAALEMNPDVLILDGDLRDRPEEFLKWMEENRSLRQKNNQNQPGIKGADKEKDKGDDPGQLERTPCGQPVTRVMAALPYILRASDEAWLQEYVKKYGETFYGFVTRNLEELEFLKEIEYSKQVIADSMLYVWNTQSVVVLDRYWQQAMHITGNENNCDGNIAGTGKTIHSEYCELLQVLPLELDHYELRETFGGSLSRMILPVYGRAPLMMTANCLRKTEGRCRKGKDACVPYVYLRDRTGAEFPVRTECSHCQNIIYNSVPTSLHKWKGDPVYREAGGLLYSFTDEAAGEVRNILRGEAPAAFTNGHFRKGAL